MLQLDSNLADYPKSYKKTCSRTQAEARGRLAAKLLEAYR